MPSIRSSNDDNLLFKRFHITKHVKHPGKIHIRHLFYGRWFIFNRVKRKALLSHCRITGFLMFTLCCILSKTKNNVKKTLFTSIPIGIRKNNPRFVRDCFVIRWIVRMFYGDVQDKMAASHKLSPQYYGVTAIL